MNRTEPADVARAGHALSAVECAAALDVDLARGLDPDEAARRLAAYGPNRLPEPAGRTRFAVLVAQLRSLLVALLVVAAVVMFAIGDVVDGVAVLAVFVLNTALGYVQERRAADALAALRRMAAPTARVRRDGVDAVVPAAELAPGDVVVVEAGDRIPADLRLVRASGLRVVEAALTGESEPADKDPSVVSPTDAAVADRRGMAWCGTTAVAGTAQGVAVATGAATEFGRIAELVLSAEEPETPLQTRLRAFAKLLTIACGGVVALVFVLGVARGLPVLDMLLAAVSLAVASVPEGLPAIVTVALAFGVAKMAKRHVLIRRLPAVETLGSTTVICADKTGTLTVGEMTVRAVASLDFDATVAGEGYRPVGAVLGDAAAARRVLAAAAQCSTARLVEKDDDFTIAGDPTEGAIVVAARKSGVDVERLDREAPVVGGAPFDATRKRMSVARRGDGVVRLFVKGAPESVVPRCTRLQRGARAAPFDDAERRHVFARNEELAERGLRVLAVASREVATADAAEAAEDDLTFLGLIGMVDPPRASARTAVAACIDAGIRPVMITGDQPATALSIARDLGVAHEASEVMSGQDLEATSDDELRRRVDSLSVFARVSPEHKLRIVEAWRARGAVVAMTGDGVNDAPALRGADIGIAMGRSGTDVAKDASAMIVTDDDFASIVAAVEEGRRIFENIQKTLLYLLTGNLAEILVMAFAVIVGWPLPLLPIQLLWINLVTEGLPALALVLDPADPDLLRRPPRPPRSKIVDRAFVIRLLSGGLLVAAATIVGFLYGLRAEGSVERARTCAFSVLVVAEVLRAFAARSPTRTLWEVGALSNARLSVVVAVTVGVQLWSHRSGALALLLHTGALDWRESAMTLVIAAVPVTVLECAKLIRRATAGGAQ